MSATTEAQLPITPYAGTSGWSGSDTSEARARRNDSDGTTARTQQSTIRVLETAGFHGVTWKELADELGLHHGSASGVLSNLHKVGKISRLTETRNRCKVYVALDFVWGRPTERPKSNPVHNCPNCGHEL